VSSTAGDTPHRAHNPLRGVIELCYSKTRLQIEDPTSQTLDSRVEDFVKHVSAFGDQHGTRSQALTIASERPRQWNRFVPPLRATRSPPE
jgi:hypothetical protein